MDAELCKRDGGKWNPKNKKCTLAKIERSPGTLVTVGRIPYVVGGGYEGKTKKLDDVVQNEATLLAKYFKRPISIRFNSDRESGGAWIKDNIDSSQVGLNARLKNGKIVYETYVNVNTLKGNVAEKYPENDNIKKYWRYKDSLAMDHRSLKDAYEWLKTNVDRNRIKK